MPFRRAIGCECCEGACITYMDEFDREDGDVSGSWEVRSGTWEIWNETLQATTDGLLIYSSSISGNKFQLDFDLTNLDHGAAAGGVIGYLDDDNYFYVEAKREDSTIAPTDLYHIRIYQVVAGVETQLTEARADIGYSIIVLDEDAGFIYHGLNVAGASSYQRAAITPLGGKRAGFRVRNVGNGVTFDNFAYGIADFDNENLICAHPGCNLIGAPGGYSWDATDQDPAWNFVGSQWSLEQGVVRIEGVGGEADATAFYLAGHPLDREDVSINELTFSRSFQFGDAWPTGTKQRFCFNAINENNYQAVEVEFTSRASPFTSEPPGSILYNYTVRLLRVSGGTATTLATSNEIAATNIQGDTSVFFVSVEYNAETEMIRSHMGRNTSNVRAPFLEASSAKFDGGNRFGYALLDRPATRHAFNFDNAPDWQEHWRHNADCRMAGCGDPIDTSTIAPAPCLNDEAAPFYKIVLDGITGAGDCAGVNYNGTYIVSASGGIWSQRIGVLCDTIYNPNSRRYASITITPRGLITQTFLEIIVQQFTLAGFPEHGVSYRVTIPAAGPALDCLNLSDYDVPHLFNFGDLDGSASTCKITAIGLCE